MEEEPPEPKEQEPGETPEQVSMDQSSERKYVKYVCNKCNYKFSMKKDSPVAQRCPYCGGDNIIEDNFDINQMIEES